MLQSTHVHFITQNGSNMRKKPFRNKLNELEPKAWLQFQKSWFIHNPPPRKKGVIRHPAKFPETLVQSFIEFFTKAGDIVLDPMAGTGSTLVACLHSGRNSIGIELSEQYTAIARQVVAAARESLGCAAKELSASVIHADCRTAFKQSLPLIDYVITSPPYWDMLHMRGSMTQKIRRADTNLDVFYSDDERDLGNIQDYEEFLQQLCGIYASLHPLMRTNAYLTIIVKNIKKGGRIYPLAWDLAREISTVFTLKDERIWCQDNQHLAPYGMGSAWVSNTFHHYCLQFRKEP